MRNVRRISAILILFMTSGFANTDNIKFTTPSEPKETIRFAVISDLTGGEGEGVFNVAVNGLAQMNLLTPSDFVVL